MFQKGGLTKKWWRKIKEGRGYDPKRNYGCGFSCKCHYGNIKLINKFYFVNKILLELYVLFGCIA